MSRTEGKSNRRSAKYQREWRKRNPRYVKHSRRWYKNNKEARRATLLKYRRTIRATAFAILGNICVRCGFADPRALQIDHVFGGGLKENKSIGSEGICRKIILGKDLEKYQLLCANCNWIKKDENEEFASKRTH